MDLRAPPDADIQALINKLRTSSKPQLQTICSVNGLPKTGNKADLQRRITQLINDCVRKPDLQRYQEVRESIYVQMTPQGSMPPPHYPPVSGTPQTPTAPSARFGASSQMYSPGGSYGLAIGHRTQPATTVLQHNTVSRIAQPRPVVPMTPGFQFKPSPFYEMKARLDELRTCEVASAMPQHRNSVTWYIKGHEIQQCSADPTMRVFVFCAGGNTGSQDIAFPHQSELKVNGGEIKANLRGLKNKPGSTRPVDITGSLRLKPGTYDNKVEFTYALTSKKYYICLIMCKATPLDVLVDKIQRKIKKESVVAELAKKAHDPDIEATSLNLSLKCPLSYMRLSRPCRGLGCSHIQCFDATSYLQLQEQGPQWLCPICNKPAPFEQLAIDEYVLDILTQTADSVEQVTIEPNGVWAAPGAKKESKSVPNGASLYSIDDLDVVACPSTNNTSTPVRAHAPISIIGTPTTTSRDSSAPARSGSKRPAEVIDLTLSDDEDDRPVKRPNLGQTVYNGGPH